MKTPALIALITAVLLLGGCSVSDVVNTGGDTKCKDFTSQDEKKQTDEISKMLQDENATDKSGGDLTAAEVAQNRESAVKYCQTAGQPDPDSKINEAPHA